MRLMNRSRSSEPSPPSARPIRYFVRDDDIGALTPALRSFTETFIVRRIPVSYQIIPARLTAECAAYLLDIARLHPELVEFGQHGLKHQMTLGAKILKREFGPERTRQQQFDDVAEGMRLLRAGLGGDVPLNVFTPPQHKFDRNTLQAVEAAGHKVFSAASYPTLHHRLAYAAGRSLGLSSIRHHGISHHGHQRPEAALREFSISIAVDNGRKITTAAGAIDAAMRRAQAHTDIVGLMFHHEVYADAPEALAAIANQLQRYPTAQFVRLSDLVIA